MSGQALSSGGIELVQWLPSAIAVVVLLVNNWLASRRDNMNHERDSKKAAYLRYLNMFDERAMYSSSGSRSDPTVRRDYMASYLEIKWYSSPEVYSALDELHNEAMRMWHMGMVYDVEVFTRKRAVLEANCVIDLGLDVDPTTFAMAMASEEQAIVLLREMQKSNDGSIVVDIQVPKTRRRWALWRR